MGSRRSACSSRSWEPSSKRYRYPRLRQSQGRVAHLFGFGICCQVTRPWGCPVLSRGLRRPGQRLFWNEKGKRGRLGHPPPCQCQPLETNSRHDSGRGIPCAQHLQVSYPWPLATNSRVEVKLVLRSPDGEVLRPVVFVWPFQFRHLRWGSAVLGQEYAKVFRHSELKMDPFSFSSLSFSYLHSSYRLLNWQVRRLLPRRYITR
jgi:hypothetical protein